MVSELKANLSAYLAAVRAGQSVIVCDRTTPVARLVPYDTEAEDGFEVRAASQVTGELRQITVVRPSRRIDVVRLLRADRDAR